MSNTFAQLKALIHGLKNVSEREILSAAYVKQDFNLMFRQAATSSSTFNIVKFLYTHQIEFALDVNASGASKKTALEFAIESHCKNTVTYLLSLEEVEINEGISAKLLEQFGKNYIQTFASDYRTMFIETLDFGTTISQLNTEVALQIKSITEQLAEKIDIFSKNTLLKSAAMDFLSEIKNKMERYEAMCKRIDKPFEEMTNRYNQFIACCSAFEKTQVTTEKDGVEEGKLTFKSLLETSNKIKSNIISSLADSSALIQIVLKEFPEETDKPSEKTSVELTQINQNPPKLPPSKFLFFQEQPEVKDLQNIKLEPQKKMENAPHTSQCQMIPKSTSAQPLKSPNEEKPKQLRSVGIEQSVQTLYLLLDDILRLKQKGQVKLQDFLSLIQSINEEVDLVLKKTKSGGLVEYKECSFSFHNPHKNDKGVDKQVLRNLQHLVEYEIKNQELGFQAS